MLRKVLAIPTTHQMIERGSKKGKRIEVRCKDKREAEHLHQSINNHCKDQALNYFCTLGTTARERKKKKQSSFTNHMNITSDAEQSVTDEVVSTEGQEGQKASNLPGNKQKMDKRTCARKKKTSGH